MPHRILNNNWTEYMGSVTLGGIGMINDLNDLLQTGVLTLSIIGLVFNIKRKKNNKK